MNDVGGFVAIDAQQCEKRLQVAQRIQTAAGKVEHAKTDAEFLERVLAGRLAACNDRLESAPLRFLREPQTMRFEESRVVDDEQDLATVMSHERSAGLPICLSVARRVQNRSRGPAVQLTARFARHNDSGSRLTRV